MDGLSVVASAVGSIPKLIVEGETGYLVPNGNAKMMAERILQLKEDAVLRERMGEKAASLTKERYDDKVMMERYLEFYQDILDT